MGRSSADSIEGSGSSPSNQALYWLSIFRITLVLTSDDHDQPHVPVCAGLWGW